LLTGLRNHVEQHQQTTGHLPATLDDLEIVKKQEVFMGANGLARDCWNNPVQYKVDGDKFVVFSYGADGQPGGTGEDLDLYSDQEPDFEKLSFWDYTMSPRTTGMKLCCLVGGLLAFPLCLIPSRPRSRVGVVKVVAMHLVTAILSIVVAAVISVVHLPSGH
jgi:hypothetical protein